MATFESSLKPRLIYIFAINDEWHKDCLKIGETTLDEDSGDICRLTIPYSNSRLAVVLISIHKQQVLLISCFIPNSPFLSKVVRFPRLTISKYIPYWNVAVSKRKPLIP